MTRAFEQTTPRLSQGAWIAPGADVIGDVELGEDASIWYGCVIRGDVMPIHIGARTNVQDLSVIHVTTGEHATTIEDDVTVGHRAILHGCTIGQHCLIGMGAILLDGVEVGEYSLIGAGTLLTPGTKIPPGSVVLGSPGRIVRQVTAQERQQFARSAQHYVSLARRHAQSTQ